MNWRNKISLFVVILLWSLALIYCGAPAWLRIGGAMAIGAIMPSIRKSPR